MQKEIEMTGETALLTFWHMLKCCPACSNSTKLLVQEYFISNSYMYAKI